jgi:hypothetical protein
VITLDSFSRRHFYRKLEKTVEYLNDLNAQGSKFMTVDLKVHNIAGSDSLKNQIHIFGNGMTKTTDKLVDQIGDLAIWNILREYGFVSLFGFEN